MTLVVEVPSSKYLNKNWYINNLQKIKWKGNIISRKLFQSKIKKLLDKSTFIEFKLPDIFSSEYNYMPLFFINKPNDYFLIKVNERKIEHINKTVNVDEFLVSYLASRLYLREKFPKDFFESNSFEFAVAEKAMAFDFVRQVLDVNLAAVFYDELSLGSSILSHFLQPKPHSRVYKLQNLTNQIMLYLEAGSIRNIRIIFGEFQQLYRQAFSVLELLSLIMGNLELLEIYRLRANYYQFIYSLEPYLEGSKKLTCSEIEELETRLHSFRNELSDLYRTVLLYLEKLDLKDRIVKFEDVFHTAILHKNDYRLLSIVNSMISYLSFEIIQRYSGVKLLEKFHGLQKKRRLYPALKFIINEVVINKVVENGNH